MSDVKKTEMLHICPKLQPPEQYHGLLRLGDTCPFCRLIATSAEINKKFKKAAPKPCQHEAWETSGDKPDSCLRCGYTVPNQECAHEWRIDGMHSNEFCKYCHVSRPDNQEVTRSPGMFGAIQDAFDKHEVSNEK